jgi:CBS domain containing-hemolysin-like protein
MSEGAAVVIVMFCLVSAGLASGLTQGLLSLDYLELTIKMRSGTDNEKKMAEAVLPLIENHHLLLVSLMLWNASAMEVLPLYLDELVPTYVAIIMSVTLILIVGEIGPAAIMTGPKQLEIAYNLRYLVMAVLLFFFVIAFPVSKFLDILLGVDEKLPTYNRSQLSEIVKIQHEEGMRRGSNLEEGVNKDEITMIDGVLKFSDVEVKDIMTVNIFMLSIDEKLSLKVFSTYFIYIIPLSNLLISIRL